MAQLRSAKTSDGDHETVTRQLHTLDIKIQEHLDLTKKQQNEAQERIQTLLRELDEAEDEDSAQITLATKEIEKQSRLLEADQVSCGVILSQVRSGWSGQEIGKVITSNDSKAFVGMPESVVGKINQRIGEVRTERRSTAFVGVFHGNFSMKDL